MALVPPRCGDGSSLKRTAGSAGDEKRAYQPTLVRAIPSGRAHPDVTSLQFRPCSRAGRKSAAARGKFRINRNACWAKAPRSLRVQVIGEVTGHEVFFVDRAPPHRARFVDLAAALGCRLESRRPGRRRFRRPRESWDWQSKHGRSRYVSVGPASNRLSFWRHVGDGIRRDSEDSGLKLDICNPFRRVTWLPSGIRDRRNMR